MKLFMKPDELLECAGFKKVSETQHGATYEKFVEEYNFTQILEISFKLTGNHLIFSYVKDVNSEGYNNVVGLTPFEMNAALKKFKELKKEYRWI